MEIRSAEKGEAVTLSDLASRSKGYWPYEREALENYRSNLEISEDEIAEGSFFVAIEQGRVIGFYGLAPKGGPQRLYFMFVEPDQIGKGYGHKLWQHALETCRARDWNSLTFYADSHASEKFYLKLGCEEVGSIDSELGDLIELRYDLLKYE